MEQDEEAEQQLYDKQNAEYATYELEEEQLTTAYYEEERDEDEAKQNSATTTMAYENEDFNYNCNKNECNYY